MRLSRRVMLLLLGSLMAGCILLLSGRPVDLWKLRVPVSSSPLNRLKPADGPSRTLKPSSLPSRPEIQAKIASLIRGWSPPVGVAKWPPYEDYHGKQDYDPNVWESFDWENDYFINNGVQRLWHSAKMSPPTPVPYLPYPHYNSPAWKKEWAGEYVPCEGARGQRLNESQDDVVRAWPVVPSGFPAASIGSAESVGLDSNLCFDRYNLYGPYGLGQEETESPAHWQRPKQTPKWHQVDWGRLQDQCLAENQDRFDKKAPQPVSSRHTTDPPRGHDEMPPPTPSSSPRRHSRTALLIRTWEGYAYTENDLETIRALVTELSLRSGGEYEVVLFINIKNKELDIFNDDQVYRDTVAANAPAEFRNITMLWSERVLENWYPSMESWGVYWHQWMPVQWFSKMHPEFDFVWNWETDSRYVGNVYDFFAKVEEFARARPRKYLWERSSRFYLPQVHGDYDSFLRDTDETVEAAVHEKTLTTVWGPADFPGRLATAIGPEPPHAESQDDFQWGVGEEADLITLLPIWDPVFTGWTMNNMIWRFFRGQVPGPEDGGRMMGDPEHPFLPEIPRRAYINTVSRMSRRQLHAMHLENLAGRSMQAEMWPATAALHHGLKAVYAPHPIWTDRKWPTWYLEAIFNADGGKAARWSQEADSVYAHDREHNFAGWSWYFHSTFPRLLYSRWLGWFGSVGSAQQYPNNPLRDLGGKNFEKRGVKARVRTPQSKIGHDTPREEEILVGGSGRMCLPAMLLHPVKRVSEAESADD